MFVSKLLNIFFSAKCPICGNESDYHLYNPFCTRCWRGIERYSGPACNICGMPTTSNLSTICELCLKKPPAFSKVLYYGIYDGALKEAIHLLKFNGVKRLSGPLSLMLSELPIPKADGIIPVPLHPNRLYKREFNQTASISRHLSKNLKIPLMIDVLKKIKETPPQTDVSGKERFKNIRNAFKVCREINGMNLLLIDDVITTGATIRECSKVLIKAGAKSVVVIALARSMPR
ncbi:ComF family protein [Dissulfurispira thermophila]|uniref:ComF family protein n=1 Tax=hot springs metagenome TaxID=433727 RepID=A0A5J4L3I9_9ZZZZ|nr:ComF family protein [Dissulfurispira thermophila]